jgi:NAD+ kinase
MNQKSRIGIYCNPKAQPPLEMLNQIAERVKLHNGTLIMYYPVSEKILELGADAMWEDTFRNGLELAQLVDVLYSVGGDGTFLGTVPFVVEGQIPVLGFNSGRLGFLANVAEERINAAIDAWFNLDYSIIERSLIAVKRPIIDGVNNQLFALNDVTIRRTDSANMLSFNVKIDELFLNNYWADGIIVATATGSTAYSLSCGGPILAPNTPAMIITPIASHNLTVRPLVISDQSIVKISVSGRSCHYSLSVDSASYKIPTNELIILEKSKKSIQAVVLNNHSFYDTIREKLSWGFDKRN